MPFHPSKYTPLEIMKGYKIVDIWSIKNTFLRLLTLYMTSFLSDEGTNKIQ